MVRCDACGRFFAPVAGCSWKMHYSGVLPEPDRESLRCLSCVEKRGAHTPDPRIKPEFSCGIVGAAAAIGAAEQKEAP